MPSAFQRKIPGTVYTKLGAASGARVPPWLPGSDHPRRVDTVNPSECRSLSRFCNGQSRTGSMDRRPDSLLRLIYRPALVGPAGAARINPTISVLMDSDRVGHVAMIACNWGSGEVFRAPTAPDFARSFSEWPFFSWNPIGVRICCDQKLSLSRLPS